MRSISSVAASALPAAGLSLAGVVALVPGVRRLALRRGITDHPSPGKVHQVVTPYLGGVAIALVALAGSSFLPQWKAEAAVIVLAAGMVACVGLVDDVRTLNPVPRLLVEIVAAVIVFAAGARVQLLGGAGDLVLTVIWLVVLTNAFNLLDNMDACAGLVATVTAVALVAAAELEGQILVSGLAALVAGTSAGFLVYNWHPAKIFMGDAGSLFLGFLLATIALKLRFDLPHAEGLAAIILLAGPALFDTTLVVISRVAARRPIWIGGTDHTSHRLLGLGVPTPLVGAVIASATAVLCGLGVAVGHGLLPAGYTLGASVLVGVVLLVALLRVSVYSETRPEVSRWRTAGPGCDDGPVGREGSALPAELAFRTVGLSAKRRSRSAPPR